MTATLSLQDVRQLRLRAQWLSPTPLPSVQPNHLDGPNRVAEVVRHMGALQGQAWPSSRWALGVRAPGVTLDDVHSAFNDGLVVRSWPFRGTIHVCAAEDIGWLQAATNRRVLAGAAKRREYLGLSDSVLAQLVQVAELGLAGGASLDRDELCELWTEAGIEWRSDWRYHVIWWLCQNGITVFGPVTGGEPRLVLADAWIKAPRQVTGDQALAEIAARYAGARGPVHAKDLAWWSGLTMGEAKQGLALAAEDGLIESVEVTDQIGPAPGGYWCAPELLGHALGTSASPEDSQIHRDWLLLPSFDEHLLGYTDRTAQLDPAHLTKIVPGRNGMFLATVVHQGITVGTWKRGGTAKRPTIEVTPLPGRDIDAQGILPELRRWVDFQQRPATALVINAIAARSVSAGSTKS